MDVTVKIYQKVIQDVAEFHRVFGLDVCDQNGYSEKRLGEILELRFNLIKEESIEMMNAFSNNEPVDFIDGMVDLSYVLAGSIVSLRPDFIEMSNDTVFLTAFGNELMSQINKNHLSEASEGHEKKLMTATNYLILSSMIEGFLQRIVEIKEQGEFDYCYIDELTEYCIAVLLFLHYMQNDFGVDFMAAHNEVHRSNMSKLWCKDKTLRQQAIDSDPERYGDIHFRFPEIECDGIVGFRKSDGKILKSPTYSPANLEPFVSQEVIDILGSVHIGSIN